MGGVLSKKHVGLVLAAGLDVDECSARLTEVAAAASKQFVKHVSLFLAAGLGVGTALAVYSKVAEKNTTEAAPTDRDLQLEAALGQVEALHAEREAMAKQLATISHKMADFETVWRPRNEIDNIKSQVEKMRSISNPDFEMLDTPSRSRDLELKAAHVQLEALKAERVATAEQLETISKTIDNAKKGWSIRAEIPTIKGQVERLRSISNPELEALRGA